MPPPIRRRGRVEAVKTLLAGAGYQSRSYPIPSIGLLSRECFLEADSGPHRSIRACLERADSNSTIHLCLVSNTARAGVIQGQTQVCHPSGLFDRCSGKLRPHKLRIDSGISCNLGEFVVGVIRRRRSVLMWRYICLRGSIKVHRITIHGRWRSPNCRTTSVAAVRAGGPSAKILQNSRRPYSLSSFFPPTIFFLLGVGILQSMEKATQLVQGTPRLAASQRTYRCQPLSRRR